MGENNAGRGPSALGGAQRQHAHRRGGLLPSSARSPLRPGHDRDARNHSCLPKPPPPARGQSPTPPPLPTPLSRTHQGPITQRGWGQDTWLLPADARTQRGSAGWAALYHQATLRQRILQTPSSVAGWGKAPTDDSEDGIGNVEHQGFTDIPLYSSRQPRRSGRDSLMQMKERA